MRRHLAPLTITLTALALAGCVPSVENTKTNASATTKQATTTPTQEVAEQPAPAGTSLILEGTATGAASVSYGSGGSISTADMAGAWSQEILNAEDTDLYLVTVQDMTGSDSAQVSCTLTENGEVVAEQTATGGHSVVTCMQPMF